MENQKVTTTGNWIWRDGEISYAEFGHMDRMNKDAHILFLSSLSENDISTNDWYILNQYAPEHLPQQKPNNFLEFQPYFYESGQIPYWITNDHR